MKRSSFSGTSILAGVIAFSPIAELAAQTVQFGNDMFLGNSATGAINNLTSRRSQRFQAPSTMTVDRVHFQYNAVAGAPVMQLAIQMDNGSGVPDGVDLAVASFTATGGVNGYTLPLDTALSLTASQTYHIVQRAVSADASNSTTWRLLGNASSNTIINTFAPNGLPTTNSGTAFSSNSGTTWSSTGIQTSLWSLSNSTTGQSVGQPYSTMQVSNLGGAVWGGQKFKYTGTSGELASLSLMLRGSGVGLTDDVRVHIASVDSQAPDDVDPTRQAVVPDSILYTGVLIPNGQTPAAAPGQVYSLDIPAESRPSLTTNGEYLLVVETQTTGSLIIPFLQGSDTLTDIFGGATTNFQGMTEGFQVSTDATGTFLPNGLPSKFISGDFSSATSKFFRDARFMVSVVAPSASVWNLNGNGDWEETANWIGGVPNSIGATANFGTIITSAVQVTLTAPQTVGVINFDSPNSYSLIGGATLTLQATTGQAAINVSAGNHTIACPLALNSDTTLNVAAASGLQITGAVSADGRAITKTGDGVAQLESIRAQSLSINGGTLKLSQKGAVGALGSASSVETLSVAANKTLDLTNNSLIINYPNGGPSPLSTVAAAIATAHAGGAWTGTGITSSAAAAVAADGGTPIKTSIGYGEASALGLSGAYGGETIDADSVIITYTLVGDANLSHSVDSTDFARFVGGYGTTSGGVWSEGDFDHNGKINTLDFNLLAGAFGSSMPAAAVTLGAVVPEPGILMLGASGIGGLMLRRRMRCS